jgi:uncharacterized protein (DUF39 family)
VYILRTISEINDRIKQGKAVVVTAEEMTDAAREKGVKQASKEIDVVTTGTFGFMCSSGAFINFGHAKPRMRMQKIHLNKVPVYGGIAAVDGYIGATELRADDSENQPFPGEFRYGGGHVIEDLVSGKKVLLEAASYGTDCYPLKNISTYITLRDVNQAYLFNPRNCYQNYNVATNLSSQRKYTYLGILKPNMGNLSYSGAGQLSPLLNDPYLQTIGIGTRILLGGGEGYVAWQGTQHDPTVKRNERGVPMEGGSTLALIGDLKHMTPRFLKGVSLTGYGASLGVGAAIPIPVLNEEIAYRTAVSDEEIQSPVIDYGLAYPDRKPGIVGHVTFAELKSGTVVLNGKTIPCSPISSLALAREIALQLKTRIQKREFFLSEAVQPLPGPDDGKPFSSLTIRDTQ